MVDTQGLVLKAFVTEANCHDGTVGTWLLAEIKRCFPDLKKIWADGTYKGEFVEHAKALGIEVEITTNLAGTGFQVLPWRWVVERTLAWLGNYRRLSKDYEYWVTTSDAMIYAAMIHLMVRRLTAMPDAP